MGRPASRSVRSYEWALLALGGLALTALLVTAGPVHGATAEVSLALALYLAVVLGLRRPHGIQQRLRFVAAYAFVMWFYLAVARITPALGTPPRDAELYAIDCALFGETPAVLIQPYAWPVLTDVFSAGYLSYLVYLNAVIAHALVEPMEYAMRLATPLFWAFAIGFAGYLLVPAVGPAAALPDAFATPLTGGLLTHLNDALVAQGSSVYDVFPSLHVLITCVLLDHDWRFAPRRFWVMLVPAGLLFGSTLYLRYHYAIDLAAGFALFLILRVLHRRAKARAGAGGPRV